MDPPLCYFCYNLFLETIISFVESLCEFVSSYRIKFGFLEWKESRCVNSTEITFYAIFFIFCYLQPTFNFYDMLKPNIMNYHFCA
jgi:hypothetical protein